LAKILAMAQKRIGRPPAGAKGEKTSEYPARTIRLPEARMKQLGVLLSLRRVSASTIVDAALEDYFLRLRGDERDIVERAGKLSRRIEKKS